VENVMAVRQDAVRWDAPVPERCPDGLVPEPPVEIPVTGDLGLLPKECQNLLDIVDPKLVPRLAYTRQVLRPSDELPVRQSVREYCRTLQVAQP
jgi:hypothetical protein